MSYLQEIIQKILKDYSLSIDDTFELRYADDNKQTPGIFRFNKHYKLETQKYDRDSEAYWCEEWNKMESVLTGELKIWPLPFRPVWNELYYYIAWTTWNSCSTVLCARWNGSSEDYMRFRLGNTFRTEEQAMASRDEIRRKITGASQ